MRRRHVQESPRPGIADGIDVKGFIDLRDGYQADGEVRLVGAQIGGNLECRKARFSGMLNAEAAVIGGVFYWTNLTDPASAKLDLTNASVGALADDLESWPAPGNLYLFGFVYQRISSGPGDAQSRLNWLGRSEAFALQPTANWPRFSRMQATTSVPAASFSTWRVVAETIVEAQRDCGARSSE